MDKAMNAPVMRMEQEPADVNGLRFLERLPVWISQIMPVWLPRQRWFGSKGRPIRQVTVRDVSLLPSSVPGRLQALVLAGVQFEDRGGEEIYFLPICLLDEPHTAQIEPDRVMALVPTPESVLTLVDGVADPDLRRALLTSLMETDATAEQAGAFHFQRTQNSRTLFPWLDSLTVAGASRLLRAEQSNTSMVFSAGHTPRLLLKCFRRVMPGLNPDYEITRALTEQTTFRAVPLLAGSILWQTPADPEPWILGIFQAFVANQGDGWEYTLHELKSLLTEGTRQNWQALLEAIRQLARRTAEMHVALASVRQEPAIAPEPITSDDLRAWEQQVTKQMHAAAEELAGRRGDLPAVWRERAAGVVEGLRSAAAAALPDSLTQGVEKVRIHGDYHLGQVLRTDSGDFVLFDFEGEPARPLAWRRKKWCVLKDVAGMLRSFGYAAHVAAAAAPGHDEEARQWEQSARREFWKQWESLVRNGHPALLPDSQEDTRAVLRVFELEKAIYELGYELHHRPDWVGIPLAALERLLKTGPEDRR